jgi:NADPH-dependent ferric siderophore reductase
VLRRASARVVAVRTARTHPQRPVRVVVSQVRDLTPSMRRITFQGPDFPPLGNDQYARLLLPRNGELLLPTTERWYPELLAMGDRRPVLRNYTLRRVRPGEVDVDFVLHDGGPAGRWAHVCTPGDVVGLIEQGAPFTPQPGNLLVVADDTGLPAALSILEALPSSVSATAVLEVGSALDQQPLARPARVVWVHRQDGGRALDTVAALDIQGRAWVAGEAGLATGVRRHLVRDRGWDRRAVQFAGYYRTGRPQYP